jgi:hypothetical protein
LHSERAEVKQLLLLIDTNKSGKISKEEWMKFMEAEFDRLDKDKTGELDAKELAQSEITCKPLHKCGEVTPSFALSKCAGHPLASKQPEPESATDYTAQSVFLCCRQL